jgi:hypothetical protein
MDDVQPFELSAECVSEPPGDPHALPVDDKTRGLADQ